jgi:hypothetical protein
MQQENQAPSGHTTICRKKPQDIDHHGDQEMETHLMSPTMARLSVLGLDMKFHIQPGNAFALLKPIGANGSNLSRRSSGKPIYPHLLTFFTPLHMLKLKPMVHSIKLTD